MSENLQRADRNGPPTENVAVGTSQNSSETQTPQHRPATRSHPPFAPATKRSTEHKKTTPDPCNRSQRKKHGSHERFDPDVVLRLPRPVAPGGPCYFEPELPFPRSKVKTAARPLTAMRRTLSIRVGRHCPHALSSVQGTARDRPPHEHQGDQSVSTTARSTRDSPCRVAFVAVALAPGDTSPAHAWARSLAFTPSCGGNRCAVLLDLSRRPFESGIQSRSHARRCEHVPGSVRTRPLTMQYRARAAMSRCCTAQVNA